MAKIRPSFTEVERRVIGMKECCPWCRKDFSCYMVEERKNEIEHCFIKGHFDEEKPYLKGLVINTEKSSPELTAKRDSVKYRYDVLYWNFIHAMAEIGHFGAEKYGDHNYREKGLTRDKSPINHIANHLRKFIEKEPYDHTEVGNNPKYHLVAIAFNAMMEYYHIEKKEKENGKSDPNT